MLVSERRIARKGGKMQQETKLDKLFGILFLLGAHLELDTVVLVLTGIAEELTIYTAGVGAVGMLAAILYANREEGV